MRSWLSIVGIGEDGLEGLAETSRRAIDAAEFVFGGPRHLELARIGERGRVWPVPFSIEPVIALRGRNVVVLASGDPFWFGVGGPLAERLDREEWQGFPGISTFSMIAARLGWRLEEVSCLGLHAAPFSALAAHLDAGRKAICLVKDGTAVGQLGQWLEAVGFGSSQVWVFQAVGGPRESCQTARADCLGHVDARSPVAVALLLQGGPGPIRANGIPDMMFQHDGQITKRPVRALTLSALAPRSGECLWDIGAGSGAIAIEWLLAAGIASQAVAIEPNLERARITRTNAAAFGVSDRIMVIEGAAPAALVGLPAPHAVFVGGGASEAVLEEIFTRVASGTRVVVNAVTLETEGLLFAWSVKRGGDLLRIEIAQAAPLGRRRSWASSRPIVQWSTVA